MPVTPRDLWALAGYVAFAGVLLAPLRHYVGTPKQVRRAKFKRDSFPLSTYPMFSTDRKGRIIVPHVVGITADGERICLHHRHYGAGGVNQVRKQVARGVRRGHAAAIAQRYADSLAAEHRQGRLNGSSPGAIRRRREAAVVEVLVVRSRFIFDDYFATGEQPSLPKEETVRARCVVGGFAERVEEPTK
ncbi:hypothetical protein [Yaniella halotolerans]|uniref:hypothetical protein n=1 Tax=Yaniella halotolerans TaxID=225453 RepID=UPI0012EB32CC|nr:hypothetical protein [Yaniella halotolerans]